MALDTSSSSIAQCNVLNGLLVNYKDDQTNECITMALKRKSRVRYKCMDTFSNLLAFGTSGGAIYLFKMKALTHSSCSLSSVIPCDQGSIEVIKFLPNLQADDLLIAIGTARGSLVIFRLTLLPGEQNPYSSEMYRAVSFTQNSSIKLIEYDQDLIDPLCLPSKIYICDASNRLYMLETSGIKQTIRLFYSTNLPSLIFSVKSSNINQISVHRSQLLISTDETTLFFNLNTNRLLTIGRKKRRRGFYGSCFFNPNHKPIRVLQMYQSHGRNDGFRSQSNSQQTVYSSTASLNDLENLLVFVARPSFRLWQVNNKLEVMFTHQFERSIKATNPLDIFELQNEPIERDPWNQDDDNFQQVDEIFRPCLDSVQEGIHQTSGDNFQRLIPIYSQTLGDLLVSHTNQELFVVDPIGARLIVWHKQTKPIIQVSCFENEIFIWSSNGDQQHYQTQVIRLVLLAPAQFILELHRLNRYLSLIHFVQLFAEQFRRTMTVPLTNKSDAITVEGGLLRNILLSTWDSLHLVSDKYDDDASISQFKSIVDDIVQESRQLKQSFENLSDSRFLLNMTHENIERLFCEPYTSLVSLEVSIANLHTEHVINFSREALNRHKSMANLNTSLQNLTHLKAQSTNFLNDGSDLNDQICPNNKSIDSLSNEAKSNDIDARAVIVERHRPAKGVQKVTSMTIEEMNAIQRHDDAAPFFSSKSHDEVQLNKLNDSNTNVKSDQLEPIGSSLDIDLVRCSNCLWPRSRSHIRPLHSSQQIQFNWLQRNLLNDFESNLDEIQELAFKHALWQLFMKCLLVRHNVYDYIVCCILLDDVRLLAGLNPIDDETLKKLFDLFGEKLAFDRASNSSEVKLCYRCRKELVEIDYDDRLEHRSNEVDAFIFNLNNLFDQLTTSCGVDIRRAIGCLRKSSTLLVSCRIPAEFYLKTIAAATLTASRRQHNQRWKMINK